VKVALQEKNMNALVFTQRFPDETACREHYRDMRIKQGVVCKKCGGKDHYWLSSKWQFECKVCHFRTTLRSGTVMENSNLSFRIWYLTILFMTSTKKGISACEMQRQLGYKRYKTIWTLMHRIRKLMGKRDGLYSLTGMIEFDEGFFVTSIPEKGKTILKRGKGSPRKGNVAVLAESTPLENINDGTTSKHCRYFKMKLMETQKAESVNDLIMETVTSESIVFSDMATNYTDIHKFVEDHIVEKSSKGTTKKTLRWVHIAISNAKRNFLGVYHKINANYLQNYLDEFVYKLNRRHGQDLFERVFVAAVFPYWYNSA
jgi:hypothetical protein